MSLKINVTLLCCLIALSLAAQNTTEIAKVHFGVETKESKRISLGDIVGYDETGTYILKTKRKGLYGIKSDLIYEHLNHDLAKTVSAELNLDIANKKKGYEYTFHSNNKLYLYSSFLDKKMKKNTFYYQELNKKTLRPSAKLHTLGVINYAGKSNYNSGAFYLRRSRNEERILLYYSLPYAKGAKEKFAFTVFDKDMNKMWGKTVTLPYMEELFDVERYKVDDKGNVYILGLEFKDKRKLKRKGEPNYKYTMISFKDNGENVANYPIELPGKFITDMQFAIADNGDIVCGGFYSEEGTFSIKGSYFLSMDGKSNTIKSNSVNEFGIDFITQNLKAKKAAKAKKKAAKGKAVELYEYELDDIILKDDGGAVLIGEQYYVRVVTRTSTDANGNTRTTTTYYYHYNDIIVININPKGIIEWTEKIPKRQVTTNDGGYFSSYALAVRGDKMHFLFNDNPANLFYKPGMKLSNFSKQKGSVVVLVTLTEEGRYSKDLLFKTKDAEVLIRPKVCEQTNDNEMILFGQRRKMHRFARLTFVD
ncbi:MAG: hypothetical protein JKX73_05355 [Flavobacteriales bacterium]|nr:hypothetical protein [Flavobacteriales bacterium]